MLGGEDVAFFEHCGVNCSVNYGEKFNRVGHALYSSQWNRLVFEYCIRQLPGQESYVFVVQSLNVYV